MVTPIVVPRIANAQATRAMVNGVMLIVLGWRVESGDLPAAGGRPLVDPHPPLIN